MRSGVAASSSHGRRQPFDETAVVGRDAPRRHGGEGDELHGWAAQPVVERAPLKSRFGRSLEQMNV